MAKDPQAGAAGPHHPPYKCQRTLEDGVCLKFYYNSNSKEYDLGPDRVACSECQYFFDNE